ncbi:MAG: hypothetical protein HYU30_04205 [Chloroflexi bacterium]|nr:hypothetical protein [Chloroflexota bacterium]
MKTGTFVALLIVVLAWGGTVGGAFAGGLVMGKNQADAAPASSLTGGSTASPTPSATPVQGTLPFRGLQGQAGGDALTQEQLDQLRQQFQNRADQGGAAGQTGGAGAFAGRGGLTGTVDRVEGNTLTVTTPQGPLTATITGATQVETLAAAKLTDIVPGAQVIVGGQRGADGTLLARTITIVPPGLSAPSGTLRGG